MTDIERYDIDLVINIWCAVCVLAVGCHKFSKIFTHAEFWDPIQKYVDENKQRAISKRNNISFFNGITWDMFGVIKSSNQSQSLNLK